MKHVSSITFKKGDTINNAEGFFEVTYGTTSELEGIQHVLDADGEEVSKEKTHIATSTIKDMLREYEDTVVEHYIDFERTED